MKTITENAARVGNFTSSKIVALTTNGKAKDSLGAPFYTYVEEKNMERRLGRSLDSEISARPTTWGKLVERRVFDLLGIEYQLASTDTLVHPTIDCWAGSPDFNKFDEVRTVGDIKSPVTLKSFCQLVDPLYAKGEHIIVMTEDERGTWVMNQIRENHKEGDTYYWQLVSNAILTGSNYAELTVYVPYKSELQTIRDMAANYDGPDQSKFAWINFAEDSELPWVPDGGFYKNINTIRFPVPQSDKDFLTSRVNHAKTLLIP